MSETITWTKEPMDGWNRYTGQSEHFGPYVIEKEDDRSYSIWWGHHDIGSSDNIASAKATARRHANSLARSDNTLLTERQKREGRQG